MTTLLIIVGALFLAVICRAALDPRTSWDADEPEHGGGDTTPIMESIALSLF